MCTFITMIRHTKKFKKIITDGNSNELKSILKNTNRIKEILNKNNNNEK